MNVEYYSDKTIKKFVKDTVCQNDKTLLRYYNQDRVSAFRRRLQILGVDSKKIQKIVYTYVTDSIRDIILDAIGELTEYMEPMGDLVISGGEAFNFYFDRNSRVVTSDIDTKFVPRFGKKNFFENLQATKLLLWDKIGSLAYKIEESIRNRLSGESSKLARLFGIRLPQKNPVVTRRYTLIKKFKQSSNNNGSVTPENVLIDVELFTLDLQVRYYTPKDGKVSEHNLGGILDIAFMRPGELGYDVASDRVRGYTYKNQNTNTFKYNPNITIASKRFLLEDLYLMQSLGLRPDKKEKDQRRMYNFAKNVLGIKNIKMTDDIFKKVLPMIKEREPKWSTKPFPPRLLEKAKRINPFKWSERTTMPSRSKLITQLLVGYKGPSGVNMKGLKKTSGDYRFNLRKKTWVKNVRTNYVKNEYNYRPTSNSNAKVNINKMKPSMVLYGYNPIRDKNMSPIILQKSTMIPLSGLKTINSRNLNVV